MGFIFKGHEVLQVEGDIVGGRGGGLPNTVRKIGKYRNTMSKVDEIPILHLWLVIERFSLDRRKGLVLVLVLVLLRPLVGWCIYFGFGFTTVRWQPLYIRLSISRAFLSRACMHYKSTSAMVRKRKKIPRIYRYNDHWSPIVGGYINSILD